MVSCSTIHTCSNIVLRPTSYSLLMYVIIVRITVGSMLATHSTLSLSEIALLKMISLLLLLYDNIIIIIVYIFLDIWLPSV